MTATPTEPAVPAVTTPSPPAGGNDQRRRMRSSDLFGPGRELVIEHAGELYLLRQTSKGKLILTK
jgi:hemin uptake protein HemP